MAYGARAVLLQDFPIKVEEKVPLGDESEKCLSERVGLRRNSVTGLASGFKAKSGPSSEACCYRLSRKVKNALNHIRWNHALHRAFYAG